MRVEPQQGGGWREAVAGLRGAFEFEWGGRQYLNVEDYRQAARRKLPAGPWAYVDGAAEDMLSAAANRDAYRRWDLRPRVLAGHGERDLGVRVAGESLATPILLAPTGLTGLAHWQGEAGAARAAESAGTRLVLSSAASYSIEEVAAATERSHFFQLYPWRDRELMASLIERAGTAGYVAMMVTVDVPVPSNRELEQRQGMGIPPVLTPRRLLDGARRPRWWYAFLKHQRVSLRNLGGEYGVRFGVRGAQRQLGLWRPDLGWDDLAWLRERWPGPMFVKGVLDPEDARRCLEIGAEGVVVSNHGGRQLDGAPATLDVLPAIAEVAAGRGQVLFDGGIRRGSDAIKALCLGADAVMIGRPAVYGLAARGERGVAEVLGLLTDEIERNLVLMGCPSVAALDRSWVSRRDLEPSL
ncbi:MAG: hypothetical protein BGO11_10650 [Solirubrobacterales bacterium 70-9]|mgnify:CR=1 FL=1|nr:MAG: hypothetical protein BGO11_10650 [Solirubrobacterales bacterium 70-9]